MHTHNKIKCSTQNAILVLHYLGCWGCHCKSLPPEFPVFNNSLCPKHSGPEGVLVSFSASGSYPSLTHWCHFQHNCSCFEWGQTHSQYKLPAQNHLPRHFHLSTLGNKLQTDLPRGQAAVGWESSQTPAASQAAA